MSALAKLLLREGACVSGSDQHDSPLLRELAEMGAKVHVGHDGAHVPCGATVISSDAIRIANPELAAAHVAGLKVMRRSQLLGLLMSGHQGIAVSGTHGKTTTTAMLARILIDAGLDPTVMVGGEALGPGGNARLGHGPHFLAEACEAYGAFLDLSPFLAIVTNVEPDHLDFHGGFEHIRAAFRLFAERVRPEGFLLVHAEDPESARLLEFTPAQGLTYGLHAGDWQARDTECLGLSSRFTVYHDDQRVERVTLNVPGEYNICNALAAFAAAVCLGISPSVAGRSLEGYHTVGRRFEILGARKGVEVVDDYAHHPTEVQATLKAARQAFTGRIIAVFQPHLFSRTRDFLNEFVESFDKADAVILTDIYAAREEPIPGVDAADIVRGIQKRTPGKPVELVNLDNIPARLQDITQEGDVVITMGAGDIRRAGVEFLAFHGAPEAERAA